MPHERHVAMQKFRWIFNRFSVTMAGTHRHGGQVHFSMGAATAHSSGAFAAVRKNADERMYADKALHKRLRTAAETTRRLV